VSRLVGSEMCIRDRYINITKFKLIRNNRYKCI
jgi:hypothetical protein